MTTKPQTERRWLRSVLAASTDPVPALPWMRNQRRRPASLQTAADNTPKLVQTAQMPVARFGAIAAR